MHPRTCGHLPWPRAGHELAVQHSSQSRDGLSRAIPYVLNIRHPPWLRAYQKPRFALSCKCNYFADPARHIRTSTPAGSWSGAKCAAPHTSTSWSSQGHSLRLDHQTPTLVGSRSGAGCAAPHTTTSRPRQSSWRCPCPQLRCALLHLGTRLGWNRLLASPLVVAGPAGWTGAAAGRLHHRHVYELCGGQPSRLDSSSCWSLVLRHLHHKALSMRASHAYYWLRYLSSSFLQLLVARA
eukprot:1161325-Pelagomonas_calceolata.AAC.14